MKPNFLLCSLAGLLLAGQAKAIQDSNANALSDVWERHYNGNVLFSASNPTHAASADPDGDGWSNEKEAVAGTNPFSPVLPAGLVQNKIVSHPEVPAMFLVSWNSLEGKSYKLRVSENLVTWADFGEVIPGTGSNIELAVAASDDEGGFPGKLFWRVVIEDSDPDGDTLNSWEEVTLGYNPNHQDTDLDGLPDNTDPLPLASATLADPDGLNLPSGLETGLIGRWDFESLQIVAPPPTGHPLTRFPDSMGGNRPAYAFTGTGLDTMGMVSKAASHDRSFTSIPRNLFGPTQEQLYTVSFWAVINPNSITTEPTGLFSHHSMIPRAPGGVPNWTYHESVANGVWVVKSGTSVVLRAGSFSFSSYQMVNGNPVAYPPASIPYNITGFATTLPAGKIDDGRWHHYTMVRSGGKTGLYLDGAWLGETGHTAAIIGENDYSSISLGRLNGRAPTASLVQPANPTYLAGKVDRLRVWRRKLELPDVQAIFRQDIDRDGLWDITENRSSTWRDTNSNGEREAEEFSYDPNPLQWSPTNGDSDRDGLNDLQEQTLGTDIARADTDGDLMPDGWEVANGLNPLLASDAALDNDIGGGDGLTNLDEYRFNADPKKRDSDGDGKLDGPEAKGPDGNLNTNDGSNPSDPRDGGNPIPPAQRVQILLGIGDKSGSHSEDYEMIVYRINPDTGSEERYYTLRSGGFGQYEEETVNFWKGDTLTFQMQWNGTNLNIGGTGASTEGPDYDYSFKVQPQGSTHGGVLIDSWKKADGTINTAQPLLNDDANDVATTQSEFRENYVDKRVVYTHFDIDIIHPASGELPEELEDQGRGGIVAVQRNEFTPKTIFAVRANKWLQQVGPQGETPTFSFVLSSSTKYKIYNGASRITSNSTRLHSTGMEFNLKVEGVSSSVTTVPRPEYVTLDFNIGTKAWTGDRVEFSVVKAEYDMYFDCYIPYEWVSIPHPQHLSVVASGDMRNFEPRSEKYRLKQYALVIPYPELSSTGFAGDLTNGVSFAGETLHYDRATSLTFPPTVAAHQGLEPANQIFPIAKTEEQVEVNKGAPFKTDWGFANVDNLKVTRKSGGVNPVYKFVGGAHEPLIVLAADIDWDVDFQFNTDNPAEPTCKAIGKTDGFPAYECYTYSGIAQYSDRTDIVDWTPDISKDVLSLLNGPDTDLETNPIKLK